MIKWNVDLTCSQQRRNVLNTFNKNVLHVLHANFLRILHVITFKYFTFYMLLHSNFCTCFTCYYIKNNYVFYMLLHSHFLRVLHVITFKLFTC